MATETKAGSVLQTWLPHPLDQQLRRHAEAERRSLSSTIRLAVEDQLRTSPTGEDRRPGAGVPRSPASGVGARKGAD
jgi:hypothetical protein